jgi:hypothetical protein
MAIPSSSSKIIAVASDNMRRSWLADGTLPPSPGTVTISSVSGIVAEGETLTVSGAGFEAKTNGPYVFADYVDKAYEYGTVNTLHSTLVDSSNVPLATATNPGRIFSSAYVDTAWPSIERTRPKRHGRQTASYVMRGPKSKLFGPTCHGGHEGWDTPGSKPKLYAAFWAKFKYDPLWLCTVEVQSGDWVGGILPTPGESVEVTDTYGNLRTGTYINSLPAAQSQESGSATGDLYEIEFNSYNSNINGQTVNFVTSGASFVFPSTGRWFAENGIKLFRAWEAENRTFPDGTAAATSSYAVHDFYTSDRLSLDGTISGSPRGLTGWAPITKDQWHLVEAEWNLTDGYMKVSWDGKTLVDRGDATIDRVTFPAEANYVSPTSWHFDGPGFDGQPGYFNEMDVESIHVENSLQRIIIANASTKAGLPFAAGGHYEIQRPVTWADGSITFDVVEGALDPAQAWYLYVFNNSGDCNEQGYPL